MSCSWTGTRRSGASSACRSLYPLCRYHKSVRLLWQKICSNMQLGKAGIHAARLNEVAAASGRHQKHRACLTRARWSDCHRCGSCFRLDHLSKTSLRSLRVSWAATLTGRSRMQVAMGLTAEVLVDHMLVSADLRCACCRQSLSLVAAHIGLTRVGRR